MNRLKAASGKGRIQNLYFGSADPNVMCLTDNENGDAIFLDDIYTERPEEIEEDMARLSKIETILAGAGDDIVCRRRCVVRPRQNRCAEVPRSCLDSRT